jgi:hypothetical protein
MTATVTVPTPRPKSGKIASYISRKDETLQSYEGIHEHQYPCQIRHQNSIGISGSTLWNRNTTRNQHNGAAKAERSMPIKRSSQFNWFPPHLLLSPLACYPAALSSTGSTLSVCHSGRDVDATALGACGAAEFVAR